jgi:hypothetical protein
MTAGETSPALSDVFMNMFDLNNQVVAAAVCAAGTVVGSLIQLRVVWRKETSERSRGVPVTKKTRRGPVLAVCLLLIGAAVGGFALSQYLVQRSDLESAAVRGQLQVQLAQIIATAERLERATLADHAASARAIDDGRGEPAATVTTTVAPCRAATGAVADATPACDEQASQPVTLCASVPAMAAVTATELYARPDDSTQAWADNRAAPGQDLGHARFADKPFERSDSDQTKQVCTGFSSWDAEKRYSARLVVRYAIAPRGSEVSRAQLVPVSAAAK